MTAILQAQALGFPWATVDPFLFCAYHDDAYPRGNAQLGPAVPLAGRDIGQDFSRKDGWSMYHGEQVPGFPAHPHRGFETVTLVRQGRIDHSDSLGATARFGGGDVQWLTAGRGIVHCEMFPLLRADADNPLELFQIWLNLPAQDKMCEPHFKMLWSQDLLPHRTQDAQGRRCELTLVAGHLGLGQQPPAPPPHSWAARPQADVAIGTLRMDAHASFTLPPAASADTQRCLYFFKGQSATIGGEPITQHAMLQLRSASAVQLQAGPDETEFLLLQGRPIGESVAQYGPFVMNTREEIMQAYADYQRTQFGGWPWGRPDPVHSPQTPRFARRPDGQTEQPQGVG